MATRYLSSHHSADDPGGLIGEALGCGAELQGPAEDILLAWSLCLADDQDPAEAAQRLLRANGHAEGPLPPGPAGRLVQLLRETAASPRGQLHHRRPRRGRAERKLGRS